MAEDSVSSRRLGVSRQQAGDSVSSSRLVLSRHQAEDSVSSRRLGVSRHPQAEDLSAAAAVSRVAVLAMARRLGVSSSRVASSSSRVVSSSRAAAAAGEIPLNRLQTTWPSAASDTAPVSVL